MFIYSFHHHKLMLVSYSCSHSCPGKETWLPIHANDLSGCREVRPRLTALWSLDDPLKLLSWWFADGLDQLWLVQVWSNQPTWTNQPLHYPQCTSTVGTISIHTSCLSICNLLQIERIQNSVTEFLWHSLANTSSSLRDGCGLTSMSYSTPHISFHFLWQ